MALIELHPDFTRIVRALERIANALEFEAGYHPSDYREDAAEDFMIEAHSDEKAAILEIAREVYTRRTGKRLADDEPIPSVPARSDEWGV